MAKKSFDDMNISELRRELDDAIWMATIGRDPSWMPVINDLDLRIKNLK